MSLFEWPCGLVVGFSLRVREVPVSITGKALSFPTLFSVAILHTSHLNAFRSTHRSCTDSENRPWRTTRRHLWAAFGGCSPQAQATYASFSLSPSVSFFNISPLSLSLLSYVWLARVTPTLSNNQRAPKSREKSSRRNEADSNNINPTTAMSSRRAGGTGKGVHNRLKSRERRVSEDNRWDSKSGVVDLWQHNSFGVLHESTSLHTNHNTAIIYTKMSADSSADQLQFITKLMFYIALFLMGLEVLITSHEDILSPPHSPFGHRHLRFVVPKELLDSHW